MKTVIENSIDRYEAIAGLLLVVAIVVLATLWIYGSMVEHKNNGPRRYDIMPKRQLVVFMSIMVLLLTAGSFEQKADALRQTEIVHHVRTVEVKAGGYFKEVHLFFYIQKDI